MAYQVLARKWRPQRFDDVVGQEHVTKTLTNAIQTGRLAHAFLFCGPRGVGKTTTARILAKCLNCETAQDGPVVAPCNECQACREIGDGVSLDVLEIDGASNRGIDEIRDLRENVRYAPSGGRAKVYVIDEVHMLTKEAFNALLKTLEEPPSGVYFAFATTEIHRVPATIRSRCQRYDFHRIDNATIEETLVRLSEREGFDVEPEAIAELARQAEGGLRDAESLLDQAAAVGGGKITLDDVRTLLGEAEDEVYLGILGACAAGDALTSFTRLQDLLDRGMDPARVALSLTQTLRDLLVAGAAGAQAAGLGLRPDRVELYEKVASEVSPAKLTALLTLASRTVADLRRSARPRLTLEVALARMCRLEDPGHLEELAARVESLGARFGGGSTGGVEGGEGGAGGAGEGGSGEAPRPRPAARGESPKPGGGGSRSAAPSARAVDAVAKSAARSKSSGTRGPKAEMVPSPASSNTAPAPGTGTATQVVEPESNVAVLEEPPLPEEPPAPAAPAEDSNFMPEPPMREAPDEGGSRRRTGPSPAGSGAPPSGASGDPGPAEPGGETAPAPVVKVSPATSKMWDDLLKRVRRRRPMLASFLEHGAPAGVDGDTLSAIFDNSYYEGMITRRESLVIIQEELAEAAGRKLEFRARSGVLPASARPEGASSPEGEAKPKPKGSQDLLARNPGLARVVHELGGQIVPRGGPAGG